MWLDLYHRPVANHSTGCAKTIEFLHAQLQEKDDVIDLLKFQLRAEREKGQGSTLAEGKGRRKAKG